MTTYKLGKRPARHAVSFKFGDFFDAKKLPTPPAVFGQAGKVDRFYGLGNDQYGNCVWAGAAHEHQVWTVAGGWNRARFTTHDTLSDYSAVTGFDPGKPDTDQGTDMADAAAYRRKTGIIDSSGKRHLIDSYVALHVGNVDQLILAMWLMGAVGGGFQLPSQVFDQFDKNEPLSVPDRPNIEGGHYMPLVGRDASGNIQYISWGKLRTMQPAFYDRFSDEAICYLSLELLNKKNLSPDGFDADGLRQALQNLS